MRQSSRELDGKPRRKMRGGVLQRADLFKLVLRKVQCKMAEVMLSSQLNSSKIQVTYIASQQGLMHPQCKQLSVNCHVKATDSECNVRLI